MIPKLILVAFGAIVAAIPLPFLPNFFPPPPPPPPLSEREFTEKRSIYVESVDDTAPDEFIDYALVSVWKPKLTTKDGAEGFLLPFTVRNLAKQKYGVRIALICANIHVEDVFYDVPPYRVWSREPVKFLFHGFQDTVNGRGEEAAAFRAGKKTEQCSLQIVEVQQRSFSDPNGPADADLSNNAFRFTLTMRRGALALEHLEREALSVSERVKKLNLPLTQDELQTYTSLAAEQCVNVLISSSRRGTYYNGEPIEPSPSQAHIAGDRIGYVRGNTVIVDGKEVGALNDINFPVTRPGENLKLNEKHFAYHRLVGLDADRVPISHLIFDGKDLGPANLFLYRLNGDFVIYGRTDEQGGKREEDLFANGKKIADGAFGDYDGKNIAYIDFNDTQQLIVNGKSIGFGGDVTFRDGHTAFIKGKTENVVEPHVMYDGKDLGRGRAPVLEKNHIAFIRAPSEIDPRSKDEYPRVVYDRKEFGKIGGFGWKISLAGDHIAYLRRLDERENPFVYPEDFARVNIDGKDYPGDFLSSDVYVEIAEKADRRGCKK